MSDASNMAAVVFRVDASQDIGAGHVTRCITLANALTKHGIDSYFVCRAHAGHMADQISSEGHRVLLLPMIDAAEYSYACHFGEEYIPWLGADSLSDANATAEYLLKINPDWLIIDHFSIDQGWEIALKSKINIKIMVIDGLANRKHECNLLLDQTFSTEGEARWNKLIPKSSKLFAGPQYALLRPEFFELRRNLHSRKGEVERIFISFGGVDKLNATDMTLDAINGLAEHGYVIDVALGLSNPHRHAIEKKYKKIENINIYVDPENIFGLMANADMAIGGGGTMMWERCLLKLPTVIISIAENQVELAKSLHEINAAVYIGDIASITSQSIRDGVDDLINNKEMREKIQNVNKGLMSENNSAVTDYLLNSIR